MVARGRLAARRSSAACASARPCSSRPSALAADGRRPDRPAAGRADDAGADIAVERIGRCLTGR